MRAAEGSEAIHQSLPSYRPHQLSEKQSNAFVPLVTLSEVLNPTVQDAVEWVWPRTGRTPRSARYPLTRPCQSLIVRFRAHWPHQSNTPDLSHGLLPQPLDSRLLFILPHPRSCRRIATLPAMGVERPPEAGPPSVVASGNAPAGARTRARHARRGRPAALS